MAETETLALQSEIEDSQEGKYLAFHVGNEEYGIEIRYVTEIIGLQKITDLPDMPDFVKGVINLRGKVIPVIDVRLRFGFEKREYDERTCIIVTNIDDVAVGLIVDSVAEVLDIPEKNVDPPPRVQKGSESRYIKGLGKVGEDVKIILEINRFLFDEELEMLTKVAKE